MIVNSVILLSGGLDSLVSLASRKEKLNITLSLTFDYGQRSAEKEILAAKAISKHFNIDNRVIKLDWLRLITNTALVNTCRRLPALGGEALDDIKACLDSAKNVWVPNRNGLFLNIAACFLDNFNTNSNEDSYIIFGANREEGATFPDNTQEFIDKINSSFEYSTLSHPKVFAPLINLNKEEIIKLALDINAPLHLLRSCYEQDQKHCGKCESCLRLNRGLQKNGKSFADFGL